jgi:hypothetical protein
MFRREKRGLFPCRFSPSARERSAFSGRGAIHSLLRQAHCQEHLLTHFANSFDSGSLLAHAQSGDSSLPFSEASRDFVHSLGGKYCREHEPKLVLELHVQTQTGDQHRAPVAVIARIVDMLQVERRIDSAPSMQCVIRFHDVFAPVVQAPIAQ